MRAIVEEYQKIRDKGATEEELKRTKDYIKGHMLMALETSNAMASFIGGEEMLTGEPLTPEEVFAKIDAVTTGDLNAAASELFRPERLNLAVLGSNPDGGKLESIIRSFS